MTFRRGGIDWAASQYPDTRRVPAGGSPNVVETSVDYQASIGDAVEVDTSNGPVKVTLPPATVLVGFIWIKKVSNDGNLMTVECSGADIMLLENAPGVALETFDCPGTALTLLSNGINRWTLQ